MHASISAALPLLLVSAYALLFISWTFSDPPGAPPDEGSHYIRALGVGRGQIVLKKRPYGNKPALLSQVTDIDPMALKGAWRAFRQTRLVSVPGNLSPQIFYCRGEPFKVDCPSKPILPPKPLELETQMGTSQPFSYALPGVFMRLAKTPLQAFILGRLATVLTSIGFIFAAVWALWDKKCRGLSLIGLVVAITPMVVFVGSSVSSSGTEILAGVCFAACLIRLSRDEDPPKWLWPALAMSGGLLGATRDMGPVWLGLDLLAFLTLRGLSRAREIFKSHRRPAIAVMSVVGICIAANLVWQLKVEPHPPLSGSALSHAFQIKWDSIREAGRHAIGVFGPLDTTLPGGAYLVWSLMTVSLMTVALLVARKRERWLLLAGALLMAVFTVVVDTLERTVGFGVQGRHILPFVVAVPLLAGEIIRGNRDALNGLGTRLSLWFCLAAAAVQFVGWHTIGRRYSVGPQGQTNFWSMKAPYWSPLAGWTAWLFVAAVATALLAAFGYFSSSPITSPEITEAPAVTEAKT